MLRVLALHDFGHETLTKRKIEGGKKEKRTKSQKNRYNRPTLAQVASYFEVERFIEQQRCC